MSERLDRKFQFKVNDPERMIVIAYLLRVTCVPVFRFFVSGQVKRKDPEMVGAVGDRFTCSITFSKGSYYIIFYKNAKAVSISSFLF